MVLIAFHMKFHAWKMGYLPVPLDPPKPNPKNQKIKEMHEEIVPRHPERRVRGAAPPREEKKGGMSLGTRAPC